MSNVDFVARKIKEQSLANGGKVLPGIEVIGAGYNPFKQYASSDSITAQLFDWTKIPHREVGFLPGYFVPEIVDVQSSDKVIASHISGHSVHSFQKSFANKVEASGGLNFFSGSLSVEYNASSLSESENSFTRIQQSISVWSLHFPLANRSRDFLSDRFRDYLDTLPLTPESADELFDNYGSHFLTGIVMGGRVVFAAATNKTKLESSTSLETSAQISFGNLTGNASSGTSTKDQEIIKNFMESSECRYIVTGGLANKAAQAFDGKDGYSGWVDSVGCSPDFVDFIDTIPLAGIWTLCKTKKQSKYLQRHYDTLWGMAQSEKRRFYADFITSLTVVSSHSANVSAPEGYVKYDVDLNSGAKGNFVYLCYTKSKFNPLGNNEKCIDDIIVISSTEKGGGVCPDTHTRIDKDLNEGIQGTYIYICYRVVDFDAKKAIKSIRVIASTDSEIPAPRDFNRVPGDLNQGAGGDFIYLYTSTASGNSAS